jgi:LysR family hydrogen peroxide-inducible transcriptional activator
VSDTISLKQLKYFAALARFEHFGRAAAHCNVTQPALSMQVRELETGLGLKLIERRPNGAELTESGRVIAERARAILAAVRDLDDFARHHDAILTGRLRLGVIPSLAPYILPPLLPRIKAHYPDLDLRIRETQTATLVGELLAGELDVLLLALPIVEREVETLGLFEDRFLLAAPAGWFKQGGRPSAARREWLAGDRLLLLEEGHCLREQALAVCDLRHAAGLDTFGASSLSTLVQMVAGGLGLTLLPEISLAVELGHGDVEVCRFEPPEPSRTVGLAWRRGSARCQDFEALGERIREAAPRPDTAPGRPRRREPRSSGDPPHSQ